MSVKNWAAIAVTGAAALVLGLLVAQRNMQPALPETEVFTLLSEPRALPALDLVNKQGAEVGREAFAGQWSLVFMGFTSCGHICPTKMAELRMIQDTAQAEFDAVFFSVDPGRDTPDVIRQYVETFDAGFLGYTGAPDSIERFAAALGAPYFVDTSPGNYVVDHSTALFLINPSAEFAGFVTPPFDIPAITRDLEALL